MTTEAQTLPEMTLPVIGIEADGIVRAIKTRAELEEPIAVSADSLPGTLIVDGDGRSWMVRSVTKVSVEPWRPWRGAMSRRARVRLGVEEGQRFDLSGLEARLLQAIDQNPHFWEAGEDIEESQAGVTTAPDIPTLIARIVERWYRTY